MQTIEQFTHTPHVAVSLVDALAQALRVGGTFPPVLGEISCEIVASTSPVQRSFDPVRVLSAVRTRSGYVMLDGSYWNADEPARRWPLGPGTYRIRMRSELYRDAEFLLQWPPAAGESRVRIPQATNADSVELLPSAAYPLPDLTLSRFQLGPTVLRGSAFASDGTPIAGVVAEVINLALLQPGNLPPLGNWPFMQAVSGANGDWALLLPGRLYHDNAPEIPAPNSPPMTKQIFVRVGYPTGSITTVQNVLLGSENSVRNTRLRGQVLGSGGRPIVGARIETTVSAATSTSGRDGSWFLYFGLDQPAVANVSVTATPASQASATDSTASVQPGATVVVPTFHFS